MNNNKNIGKLGEEIAHLYLINKKYKILEQNYKCKYGEIDIIAEKNNIISFIEVKTRQNIFFGNPVEAITKMKQKHIYNSATYYLIHQKIHNSIQVQLDAIEIYIQWPSIKLNHIKGIIIDQIQ